MAKRKYTRKTSRQTKKTISVIISVAVVALCFVLSRFVALPGTDNPHAEQTGSFAASLTQAKGAAVKVHIIDVGQADATLLEANGAFALIDAGTPEAKERIFAYLNAFGVKSLEYFIVTHPHADHIGSAADILNEYSVKNVLLPQLSKAPLPTTKVFEKMLDAIDESGAEVHEMALGDSFALGDAKIDILADGVEGDNLNNISPFIKFSGGDLSFICSGDAEKEAELAVLENNVSLKADIFKAAHHGSSTSNTKPLFNAISPVSVSISCGEGNSYGHPHKEVTDTFKAIGADVYITSEVGSIIFFKNESGELCAALQREDES